MIATPPARARFALPGAQALAGQVHGDERRRARRVDREARSLQPEHDRRAGPRPRCRRAPGAGVGVDARGVDALQDPQTSTRCRRSPRRRRCGVLARPSGANPACSSASQATSRSSRCCGSMLPSPRAARSRRTAGRRDRRPSRKPPLAGVHLPRRLRVGIVERVDVPAIAPGPRGSPSRPSWSSCQNSSGPSPAGEPAAHPDDRDRLRPRASPPHPGGRASP